MPHSIEKVVAKVLIHSPVPGPSHAVLAFLARAIRPQSKISCLDFELFNRQLDLTGRRGELLLGQKIAGRERQTEKCCWENSPHTMSLPLRSIAFHFRLYFGPLEIGKNDRMVGRDG